jgi:haloalkane dehalogenase
MTFPDYPFTSHYADISGFKMHYLDEGPKNGEPVIMLHGNPSWSFYYRHLVSALKGQYRCIVPDHIGMGLSEKPSSSQYDFLFTRRAQDLDKLLDQLTITRPVNLILHDWGGMIGMLWASKHTEQVKRLVILNTAAFHLPKHFTLPMSLRLGRTPILNRLLIQGLNLFCRGAIKHCVNHQAMPKDIASAYIAPYDNWANRIAVRRFVEDIPLKNTDPGYQKITEVEDSLQKFQSIPILILWGMKDFVFNKDFLEEWLRIFPYALSHRFEDAGHYLLEDEADNVISLIHTFLDKNPMADKSGTQE